MRSVASPFSSYSNQNTRRPFGKSPEVMEHLWNTLDSIDCNFANHSNRTLHEWYINLNLNFHVFINKFLEINHQNGKK